MLSQTFVVVLLTIFVSAEEVHKKLCSSVDSSQCVVSSVDVQPCLHGPRFCSVILGKRYTVNVNFTPYFSAHNLSVSVTAVSEDGGSFSGRTYKDACSRLLTCPLEAHVRQSFEVPLSFDSNVGKMYGGKYPVEIKLWNAEDETQTCCFSFKAKLK